MDADETLSIGAMIADDEAHPRTEEESGHFIDTPYWNTSLHVWLEVNLLHYHDILKLYIKRKDLQESDINITNEHLFVRLRGIWYQAEKAAFTTRYQEKNWETNLEQLEAIAKHCADILDQFFEELRRPAEYEDGAVEVMAQKEADLRILSLRRGTKAQEAREKIAAKAAATAEAEDPQEICKRFFRAEKTLFDHCLMMIEMLRKEIDEERSVDISHKKGEKKPMKDEDMT